MRHPILRDIESTLGAESASLPANAIDLAVDALREMRLRDPEDDPLDAAQTLRAALAVFEDPDVLRALGRLRRLASLIAILPRRFHADGVTQAHRRFRRQTMIVFSDGVRIDDGSPFGETAVVGEGRVGTNDRPMMLPVVGRDDVVMTSPGWKHLMAGTIVEASGRRAGRAYRIMKAAARFGDRIEGGLHCHGHDHGPQPSPGTIVTGASKVHIESRPAAREGDTGFSPQCCGNVGRIEIRRSPTKVFIEGKSAAGVGTPTVHCDSGPGIVSEGAKKTFIP